jgi:hypothetical protein
MQTFESQKSQKLVLCPVCRSSDVDVVLSCVAIMGKDGKDPDRKKLEDTSPQKALRFFMEYVEKNFDDLGDRFAEVALKIHHGEEDRRNIKGTTTEHEEEMLKEEGVPFVKISLPKYDG